MEFQHFRLARAMCKNSLLIQYFLCFFFFRIQLLQLVKSGDSSYFDKDDQTILLSYETFDTSKNVY
jgi:hypothetical protein